MKSCLSKHLITPSQKNKQRKNPTNRFEKKKQKDAEKTCIVGCGAFNNQRFFCIFCLSFFKKTLTIQFQSTIIRSNSQYSFKKKNMNCWMCIQQFTFGVGTSCTWNMECWMRHIQRSTFFLHFLSFLKSLIIWSRSAIIRSNGQYNFKN